MTKKTICLNMIVKNEAHVIERCLSTLKHLIDYWVIVDTGSSDGTQDLIKKQLSGIPGELHERPWVDFSFNRNEAMDLAKGKGDYLLIIDADDGLQFEDGFELPELVSDLYSITQRERYFDTFRDHHVFFLIKNEGEFEWRGKIHEYLATKTSRDKTLSFIPKVLNIYGGDSSRNKDPDKIKKDIELLNQSIKENPNETRNFFYLARTYYSIENFEEALRIFEKCSELDIDEMERYYSLLYIAICQMKLKKEEKIYINSLINAYIFRPSRAEAIYELSRIFFIQGNYLISYLFAKEGASIPHTKDTLFVETWVNDWGCKLYQSVCAFALGRHSEALPIINELIENKKIPDEIKKQFKLNELKEKINA